MLGTMWTNSKVVNLISLKLNNIEMIIAATYFFPLCYISGKFGNIFGRCQDWMQLWVRKLCVSTLPLRVVMAGSQTFGDNYIWLIMIDSLLPLNNAGKKKAQKSIKKMVDLTKCCFDAWPLSCRRRLGNVDFGKRQMMKGFLLIHSHNTKVRMFLGGCYGVHCMDSGVFWHEGMGKIVT